MLSHLEIYFVSVTNDVFVFNTNQTKRILIIEENLGLVRGLCFDVFVISFDYRTVQ